MVTEIIFMDSNGNQKFTCTGTELRKGLAFQVDSGVWRKYISCTLNIDFETISNGIKDVTDVKIGDTIYNILEFEVNIIEM